MTELRTSSARSSRTASGFLVLLLCTVAASCTRDPYVGTRYRAEREIYRINQEFRRLSIQPQLVDEATWRGIAQDFEALAQEYRSVRAAETPDSQSEARQQLRSIVARAYVGAAQVYGLVGDSLQVIQNYERVVADYQDLPLVVAEVALAQGRLFESRKELENATESYQGVIERIEPQPGEPGVPGVVLELPLRIARLHAQMAMSQETSSPTSSEQEERLEAVRSASLPSYETARAQYAQWVREHSGTRIEHEARMRLADLAADLGQWEEALSQIRTVETQVADMQDPVLDAGNLRLTGAMIQSRASMPPDSVRGTLQSILQDYPESPAAPQALMGLAQQAASLGQAEAALDYLDRLGKDYPGSEKVVSQSMLLRAQVLEADGRWPAALEVLRALPVQHPLSEAALQAPLEIVAHHVRSDNQAEVDAALVRAENEYRDIIQRYPPGPQILLARTKLVQTLLMQKRPEDAIGELLTIADSMRENPRAAAFLVEAARVAQRDMNDSERAAEILERVGTKYPNMQIGRWASDEASRLREVKSE